MALNIVSPGPLTTVQDFGRHGHQAEGYPECASAYLSHAPHSG